MLNDLTYIVMNLEAKTNTTCRLGMTSLRTAPQAIKFHAYSSHVFSVFSKLLINIFEMV